MIRSHHPRHLPLAFAARRWRSRIPSRHHQVRAQLSGFLGVRKWTEVWVEHGGERGRSARRGFVHHPSGILSPQESGKRLEVPSVMGFQRVSSRFGDVHLVRGECRSGQCAHDGTFNAHRWPVDPIALASGNDTNGVAAGIDFPVPTTTNAVHQKFAWADEAQAGITWPTVSHSKYSPRASANRRSRKIGLCRSSDFQSNSASESASMNVPPRRTDQLDHDAHNHHHEVADAQEREQGVEPAHGRASTWLALRSTTRTAPSPSSRARSITDSGATMSESTFVRTRASLLIPPVWRLIQR